MRESKSEIKVRKDGTVRDGCVQIAKVERRGKVWEALTPHGKPYFEEDRPAFRTRKAAVEAIEAEEERRAEERRIQRARWLEERERKEAAAREEAKDPRCVERYVERILAAAPEGWTAEFLPGVYLYGRESYAQRGEASDGTGTVVLKSEAEELHWRLDRVNLKHGCGLADGAVNADGSTYYRTESGGWACFDRIGVDSSFYGGSAEDPAETVREELERIEKAREVSKKMVSVPKFGWRVHQDALEELRAKIQRGGSHSFSPRGFGTGKRISARRPAGRYGVTRLPAETAEFFGVPVLWSEDFDCD